MAISELYFSVEYWFFFYARINFLNSISIFNKVGKVWLLHPIFYHTVMFDS